MQQHAGAGGQALSLRRTACKPRARRSTFKFKSFVSSPLYASIAHATSETRDQIAAPEPSYKLSGHRRMIRAF